MRPGICTKSNGGVGGRRQDDIPIGHLQLVPNGFQLVDGRCHRVAVGGSAVSPTQGFSWMVTRAPCAYMCSKGRWVGELVWWCGPRPRRPSSFVTAVKKNGKLPTCELIAKSQRRGGSPLSSRASSDLCRVLAYRAQSQTPVTPITLKEPLC